MKVGLWSIILMKLCIQKGKRMNKIIRNVRDELKQTADDKTKKASKDFSRKRSNATEWKLGQLSKLPKNIFPKFKGWARKKHSIYATNYLNLVIARGRWWRPTGYWFRKDLQPVDFKVFETWIEKYINNWTECDTLCNHTVGSFIEQYAQYLDNLKNGPNRKIAGCGGLLPFR